MLRKAKWITAQRCKEHRATLLAFEFDLNAFDTFEPCHVGGREDFGLRSFDVDLQKVYNINRLFRHQGRHRDAANSMPATSLGASINTRRPRSSVLLGHLECFSRAP